LNFLIISGKSREGKIRALPTEGKDARLPSEQQSVMFRLHLEFPLK
jgi:hypothetical protein